MKETTPLACDPTPSVKSSKSFGRPRRGIFLKCSLLLGFALALGSCYFWFVWPLVQQAQSDRGWLSSLMSIALCLVFGTPGLLLLYAANQLRQQVDRYTIKKFCGVLYGILMLVAGLGGLRLVMQHFVGVEAAMLTHGSLFAAIAGLLPIYVLHAKCLMREAGIVPQRGEFFGRPVLQLLAFLMGMSLLGLLGDSGLMELDVILENNKSQLQMAGLLGVLLLPYLCYKISVYLLIPKSITARSD